MDRYGIGYVPLVRGAPCGNRAGNHPVTRRSLYPCRHPGCGALITSPGYCSKHQHIEDERLAKRKAEQDKRYNARRPEHAAWYKTSEWQSLRARVLRARPLCVMCEAHGKVTPAKIVDHITPVAIAPDRMFDETNLQPLCQACHNQKTADERRGGGGW